MRAVFCSFFVLSLSLAGCQKAGEAAISAATGGQVKIDGTNIDVKGKDGSVAHVSGDGKGGALTVTATDKDGKAVNANWQVGPGAQLPPGFPSKVMGGLNILSSTNSKSGDGKSGQLVMLQGKVAHADAVSFYEAEQKRLALGKDTKANMSSDGSTTTIMSSEGNNKSASFTVTTDKEGQTTVMIGLGGF